MRRGFAVSLLALLIGLSAVVPALAQTPPYPDPAFIKEVPGAPCTPENPYEKHGWKLTSSAQAGDKCKRIHFTYGPITVKPGQNDVLLGPVTIEKPAYDGVITRFKPDLVDATGEAPPIHTVHLHHGTWLNAYPQYGNGPFFASGEEKTIGFWPKGYGMHVGANDQWLLLYMVHSAVTQPTEVWITYDIDFVADEDAAEVGIVPTKPVWLDVQSKRIAKGAPETGGNPVYNSQKGFGHLNKDLGIHECSWPRENCARHDVYGGDTPQQGKPIDLAGADWKVTEDMAGTLILMGGHLHPGGIRDEVSLVRDGKEKLIHISDAVYWDKKNDNKVAPTQDWNSWNFSMTGTGSQVDWKVNIKKGDILRLNSVYESEYASWYENMGIVMAWVATKDPQGPAGVDVFDDNVKLDPRAPAGTMQPPGVPYETGCVPKLTGANKTLCLRGQITHGAMPEAQHFGGCHHSACEALPKEDGPLLTDIPMPGFTYGPADISMIYQNGVPLVKKGEPVKFWNTDTFLNIWHTVTRCKEPCTGMTGLDYPTANGSTGPNDKMDFDSTEMGYGVFFSPASGQLGDDDKSTEEAVQDGLYWEFTPTETGTYSFFCRIHPGMRGAIRVVK